MPDTEKVPREPRALAVPRGAVVRIQKIGGDYFAEPETVPVDEVRVLAAPLVAVELRTLAQEPVDGAGLRAHLRRRADELDRMFT